MINRNEAIEAAAHSVGEGDYEAARVWLSIADAVSSREAVAEKISGMSYSNYHNFSVNAAAVSRIAKASDAIKPTYAKLDEQYRVLLEAHIVALKRIAALEAEGGGE